MATLAVAVELTVFPAESLRVSTGEVVKLAPDAIDEGAADVVSVIWLAAPAVKVTVVATAGEVNTPDV